jgi:glycosyltransferase involved in cell wall biosynthesis
MNKSALFISTLNEIEGITQLFPKIPIRIFDQCFALDGGSIDGTIEFFEEKGIQVIRSIKKGEIFNIASKITECEYLVFFAPDGNENPDDILILLKLIREECDMAIASRFMKGARNEEDDKLFPWRAWANKIFTFMVRMIWGGKITDTINGFRAIRRSKLLEMNLDPTGFDIEYQMTIRGLKMGHIIKEIPTREDGRIGGVSTARSFPVGILMLKRLFNELFIGLSFNQTYKK